MLSESRCLLLFLSCRSISLLDAPRFRFSDLPFSLVYSNVRFFFHFSGFANHYDKEMKHALGVKGAGNLNVYTVQTKEAADVTVNLGYAQYPWSYSDDPEGDGIVMQHYTLPDSGVVSSRRDSRIRSDED